VDSPVDDTGSANSADLLHQPALKVVKPSQVFHFLWKSTLLRDAHFVAENGECDGFTRV
jgi:hypothetical protein